MMKRPIITEFMGDGFTLNKAHKQYLENLELWNYVQALDAYCDELEKMQNVRVFVESCGNLVENELREAADKYDSDLSKQLNGY